MLLWLSRDYIVNLSPSMPLGVYKLSPVNELRVGDIVAVCLPEKVAKFGRERGYLRRGHCNGAQGVLKYVAALTGDEIDMRPTHLSINNIPVIVSPMQEWDSKGRPLPHYYFGNYQIREKEVWLMSTARPNSWDSRYFGPVTLSDIIAKAERVFP